MSETQSPLYYHANCEFKGHRFTADVVLDENLFRVGRFVATEPGIIVADLRTLLSMKMAILVSRCAEKDLYDLRWLRSQLPNFKLSELIALGHSIDGGVNAENLLAAISGADLRESACDFSLDSSVTAKGIYKEIQNSRDEWIRELIQHLENEPAPPLAKLVKKAKKRV